VGGPVRKLTPPDGTVELVTVAQHAQFGFLRELIWRHSLSKPLRIGIRAVKLVTSLVKLELPSLRSL
jgi:hypothetical protein